MEEDKGTLCVSGGTGYVASWLVMRLLQRGYTVRATVRFDPDQKKDISYLTTLPGAPERLHIFNADLNQPESFNEVIQGCVGVFHVAHPVDIGGEEPEEVVTQRAMSGLLGILNASLNSKTVRRVVYTSSLAAVMNNYTGQSVMDESTWSDIDFCRKVNKVISPSYTVSKTVIEKEALEFGERHGLDVVTLVLPLVIGPFICPNLPTSVYMALNMIFGKEDQYKYVVCVSYMVHIDDAANAHIFLLELPYAKGRYLCSAAEVMVDEMYNFISTKYPGVPLLTHEQLEKVAVFDRVTLSSKKLLDSGYKFQYGVEEMLDGAIQCCKEKGYLWDITGTTIQ